MFFHYIYPQRFLCFAFFFIALLIVIYFGLYTQDGPALVYEGVLFKNFINDNFIQFEDTFSFHFPFTSYGGIIITWMGVIGVGTKNAEWFPFLFHLVCYTIMWCTWSKYIKPIGFSVLTFWLAGLLLFFSLPLSKGFYNYLIGLDLVLFSLPYIWHDSKSFFKIVTALILFISSLFHPLPVIILVPLIIILSKNYRKLMVVIPSMIPVFLHIINNSEGIIYSGYNFKHRLGDLVKGLSLVSYHTGELLYGFFFLLIMLSLIVYTFIKNKNYSDTLLHAFLFLFIFYFVLPVESSGGGLMDIRIAWLFFFTGIVYIIKKNTENALVNYLLIIFCTIFLYKKTIVFSTLRNLHKNVCNSSIKRGDKTMRLYTNIYPSRKSGWLIPLENASQIQQEAEIETISLHHHYSRTGYYMFFYKIRVPANETLSPENYYMALKYNVRFIFSDTRFIPGKYKRYCSFFNRADSVFYTLHSRSG